MLPIINQRVCMMIVNGPVAFDEYAHSANTIRWLKCCVNISHDACCSIS